MESFFAQLPSSFFLLESMQLLDIFFQLLEILGKKSCSASKTTSYVEMLFRYLPYMAYMWSGFYIAYGEGGFHFWAQSIS